MHPRTTSSNRLGVPTGTATYPPLSPSHWQSTTPGRNVQVSDTATGMCESSHCPGLLSAALRVANINVVVTAIRLGRGLDGLGVNAVTALRVSVSYIVGSTRTRVVTRA